MKRYDTLLVDEEMFSHEYLKESPDGGWVRFAAPGDCSEHIQVSASVDVRFNTLRWWLATQGWALVPAADVRGAGITHEQRVTLWDAINRVVAASGGNPGDTSVARQKAVAEVESVVSRLTADAPTPISDETLRHLNECAQAWDPEARPLGNVTALELRAFCAELAKLRADVPTPEERRIIKASLAFPDEALAHQPIPSRLRGAVSDASYEWTEAVLDAKEAAKETKGG